MAAAIPGDGLRSIRAVAAFEAGKGLLALCAVLALALLGPAALKQSVGTALAALGTLPDATGRPSHLDRITPETVGVAMAVIALYGLMRLVEGWGLWRHRIWASWLGCIGAAVYLPFEAYALYRHPDWLTLGVLAVNLLIVAVLARDILRRRRT
jgi:uncharacterized membrane protein (DUF2068 family)